MCGEKLFRRSRCASPSGSPPRVRGKGHPFLAERWHFGITPACAGKSVLCIFHDFEDKGSPPRVRGKVGFIVFVQTAIGITPACAGKRLIHANGFCWPRDHPRVCGEKLFFLLCGGDTWGSPPRVRGKVTGGIHAGDNTRITPACAGKRLKRSHSIGHFSCILCLFHSVLHRASVSGGSRAGPCAPPCLPAQNAVPV